MNLKKSKGKKANHPSWNGKAKGLKEFYPLRLDVVFGLAKS